MGRGRRVSTTLSRTVSIVCGTSGVGWQFVNSSCEDCAIGHRGDLGPSIEAMVPDDVAPPPFPAPRRAHTRGLKNLGVLATLAVLVLTGLLVWHVATPQRVTSLGYAQFMADAGAGKVVTVTADNSNGVISGQLTNGSAYATAGPIPSNIMDLTLLRTRDHLSIRVVGTTPILHPGHALGGRAALLNQYRGASR